MKTKVLLLSVMLLAVGLVAANPEKPARLAGPDRKAAKRELPKVAAGLGGVEQVLTDEQRQKFREYMQAGGEKLRASQREMMSARRELLESVVSGKADDALIKEKSEAIAKMEAEALHARMNALAKVAATLTPEQKEKLKELSGPMRAARPGLGARLRKGDAPPAPPEPAAPPPPEK